MGESRPGFVAFLKKANPQARQVQLTYYPLREPDGLRPLVGAEIYGIAMVTDSRLATPPAEIPEDLAMVTNF